MQARRCVLFLLCFSMWQKKQQKELLSRSGGKNKKKKEKLNSYLLVIYLYKATLYILIYFFIAAPWGSGKRRKCGSCKDSWRAYSCVQVCEQKTKNTDAYLCLCLRIYWMNRNRKANSLICFCDNCMLSLSILQSVSHNRDAAISRCF